MNIKLTEEIAYHILAHLGALPANFTASDTARSMIDRQFLLPEKLKLTIDNQELSKNIYGCQVSVAGKDLRLLLADCSLEKNLPEYCLMVQLKGAPAYGVYLLFNRLVKENPPTTEVLIALSSDSKNWMPCNTYLQASLLASMEQLRDVGGQWGKCQSYQEQLNLLFSFVAFRDLFFGGADEG